VLVNNDYGMVADKMSEQQPTNYCCSGSAPGDSLLEHTFNRNSTTAGSDFQAFRLSMPLPLVTAVV
jgi:hypothetical protein